CITRVGGPSMKRWRHSSNCAPIRISRESGDSASAGGNCSAVTKRTRSSGLAPARPTRKRCSAGPSSGAATRISRACAAGAAASSSMARPMTRDAFTHERLIMKLESCSGGQPVDVALIIQVGGGAQSVVVQPLLPGAAEQQRRLAQLPALGDVQIEPLEHLVLE